MLGYVVRRILIFLASLVAASVLVFFVMSVLPGDPAAVMLGTQATPESVEALREELGLNRPFLTQYFDWAWSAVRGDLGVSFFSGIAIGGQIVERLKVTLPLAFIAMGITILVAFPAGVFAAARHRKPADTFVSVSSQIGLAIPAFWAGLILVTVFAVNLSWFPAGGFPGWA